MPSPAARRVESHSSIQWNTRDIHGSAAEGSIDSERAKRIRMKNRRKRYLDTHPEYFSSDLELADPLLYDRLIRRFQTASERESDGRKKGYSGTLEADLMRAEAKLEALARPDSNMPLAYSRSPNGEIVAEEVGEIPADKEEGLARWRREMQLRFLRGEDQDIDYSEIDGNEDLDDHVEEERARQDEYFSDEDPTWQTDRSANGEGGGTGELSGETGIQDF